MLRRICNICGEVIDGEPPIEKEYADLVLVMDDEIALIYEDVCDKHKAEIHSMLLNLGKGKRETANAPEPVQAPQPQETEDDSEQVGESKPEANESAPAVEAAPPRIEELPEQVTKRFPIKINAPQPAHPSR